MPRASVFLLIKLVDYCKKKTHFSLNIAEGFPIVSAPIYTVVLFLFLRLTGMPRASVSFSNKLVDCIKKRARNARFL